MAEPDDTPDGIGVDRMDDFVLNTRNDAAPIPVEQVEGPYTEAAEPSFFESVGELIPYRSVWSGIFRRMDITAASFQGVPIGDDPEALYNRVDRAGALEYMTLEDWKAMAQAETTAEVDERVSQLVERKQIEQQLADKGFVQQLVGEMMAYSADPVNLMVDAAVGGSARGPMMMRFLSGGSRTVVASALVDAALTVDERTYTPEEIGYTAMAAFGLGGAFGVVLGPRATPGKESPRVKRHVGLSDDFKTSLGLPVVPRSYYLTRPDGKDPKKRLVEQGRMDKDGRLIPLNEDDAAPTTRPDDPQTARDPETEVSRQPTDAETNVLNNAREQELVDRAGRLLSDDDLIKAQQTIDDLSIVENPTNAQSIRLERAAKRLDDHEDAKQAIQELEQRPPKAVESVEELPTVQRQFEGLEFVREAQRRTEADNRARQSQVDEPADEPDVVDPNRQDDDSVIVDTPKRTNLSADQVEDAEIANSAPFGIHLDNAEDLIDAFIGTRQDVFAPDKTPEDMSLLERTFMRMTPATRAAIVKNPHVRALVSAMFTKPWTTKGSEFNPVGWEDQARRMFDGPENMRAREHRAGFKEWFEDTKKNGEFFKLPYYLQFRAEEEFSIAVGKAIQQLQAGRTPDVHPGVMKAVDAMDKWAETHWKNLQRTGVIPEDMERPYKYYLPQIVDRAETFDFVNSFSSMKAGLDALAKLYAKGMNVPLRARLKELVEEAEGGTITPETQERLDALEQSLVKVISQAYARRAFSYDLSVKGMVDVDAIGLHLENVDAIRKLLTDELVNRADPGVDIGPIKAEIDEIVASLTRSQKKRADVSTPNRLKGRMDLDMDASIRYVDKKGQTKTIRLGDLYEKDVNISALNYGRWAAAEATLARSGTSVAQLRKAIDELTLQVQRQGKNPDPDEPTKSDINLLEYGYRAVLNLPAHTKEEHLLRAVNSLKNLTYALKMGAAFVHSFSEAYTIAAQMGIGNTLKEMPALGRIIKSYAQGKIDPGLHQDLYDLNGAAFTSLERSMSGSRFDTDLTGDSANAALRLFEKTGEGAKRIFSRLNLLPATTDITRQFATLLQLKQLDRALRGEKMPSWWDGIRRQYGLSDEGIELLKSHFLSDKVSRKSDGSIDFDGDLGLDFMPAEARMVLEDFLYRSSTTIIQEVFRGNLPMSMTGPIGSLLLQFRSFEVAATTRHLAADVSRRDMLALNKFVGTSLVATLGYAARAYAFSGGDSEVIEERLQLDRVISNGVAYSVSAGAMPTLVDTVMTPLLGGVSPFNRYRTTGVSDNLATNLGIGNAPFASIFGNAYTAAGTFAQMPYDIADGEGPQISRQQARAIMSIVGADTLWFLRPGKEYILANMPKESDLERGNILTATGLDD